MTNPLLSKREQNGVLAILRFPPGAGVTPAQGGAEPTVGSALNKVISPSPLRRRLDRQFRISLLRQIVVQIRAQIRLDLRIRRIAPQIAPLHRILAQVV